jgi:hypothetical protein
MSRLPHPGPNSIAQGKKEDEMAGGFTRRTVLAGAAAATAAMSVGAVDSPANAQTRQDLILFVLLSGALTGIAEVKLAPQFRAVPSLSDIDLEKSDPGSDPVDIKQEYFNWVNKRRQATLRRLLQITKDSLKSSDRQQVIIDKVQATPDTKYLARSIVLMWYLGAWYDPDNLRALAEQPNPPAKASSIEDISPKAYTQGWALRVAQAHPMGFSEMQFGYWARPPSPRTDFIGN